MASDSKFQQECVEAHNRKRALHGVSPLRIADDLASSAQSWADTIAKSGRFAHSQNRNNVGENIAMKWSSDPAFAYSGNDATDQWYSEIDQYTFGTEDINCGHFTQVVWKSTTEAGFGRAKAADGKVYIVGQYRPAGNLMGHWSENVPPLQQGSNKAPKAEQKPVEDRPAEATSTSNTPKKQKKGGVFSCFKKSD